MSQRNAGNTTTEQRSHVPVLPFSLHIFVSCMCVGGWVC